MEADFSIETVEGARTLDGHPDIFNADHGSQFTFLNVMVVMTTVEIAILMDDKAAWQDNVLVERLWRSVKYEEVYLRARKTVPDGRVGMGRYLTF